MGSDAATSAGARPAEVFAGSPVGRRILRAVEAALARIGPAQVRVSASQVTFRRRRGFAFVWRPSRWLRSPIPAVLSIAFASRVDSPRWKSIAHPAPRIWMHHLELASPDEVDAEVAEWLRRAWDEAA